MMHNSPKPCNSQEKEKRVNATLPGTLLRAMAPMAPPASIVHHIMSQEKARAIDAAMLIQKNDPQRVQKLADKLQREEARISALMS